MRIGVSSQKSSNFTSHFFSQNPVALIRKVEAIVSEEFGPGGTEGEKIMYGNLIVFHHTPRCAIVFSDIFNPPLRLPLRKHRHR